MQFSAVQLLSQLNFATPWTVAHQASLSITNSQSLLKLISIESVMPSNHPLSSPSPAFNLSQHQGLFKWVSSSLVMPSNHLILCRPLLLPSVFPRIRVFSNESVLRIRWPKYWNFSFSISPSNEYSRLISFRMGLVGSPCSLRVSQESSPTP